MLATLSMYDWPEIRGATDAFWHCLRHHAGLQLELTRDLAHGEDWQQPGLVFSQTCGYPYTHQFAGKLNYIATPHYAADGCEGANYCSIVLAREKRWLADFKGGTAIVNNPDSMSGMLALQLVFAPYAKASDFFASTRWSGSHRESLRLLQAGEGDICAVDAVCMELAKRYRPDLLEGLVEVTRGPSVPGLPFVNTTGNVEGWRRALAATFSDPQCEQARQALLMTGFSVLPPDAYARITILEEGMLAGGGLRL